MAPGPHVRSETRGGVRRITLARPESGNRITEPLALAFIDAVRRAIEDDEVSVVVVAGSGRGLQPGGRGDAGRDRARERGAARRRRRRREPGEAR